MTVFGITSNLAQIKLVPALYDLFLQEELPSEFKILGIMRQKRDKDELKNLLSKPIVEKQKSKFDPQSFDRFWKSFHFINGDISSDDFYDELHQKIVRLGAEKTSSQLIFYLATHPQFYEQIFKNTNRLKINKNYCGKFKILIEKPIGNDFETSHKLNRLLGKFFSEKQVYRIDHYLAKETIQNILAFRFNNEIFEKVLSARNIDHIQITWSEEFGADLRSAFYDATGALKDVGQNHLLQMLVFATMNRPKNMSNKEVTRERLKVLRSLCPLPQKLVLGQYRGYEGERSTNTFFAFKTYLKSGKFKNVPVYIRAGKKMNKTVAETVVVFKDRKGHSNALVYRIQPNEGIILRIVVKKPGMKMEMTDALMQFCYRSLHERIASAYEKLMLDAINGEQVFFNDAKEVECSWKFIDGLEAEEKQVECYEPGSWGPAGAEKLIKEDGREWFEPSEDYCIMPQLSKVI